MLVCLYRRVHDSRSKWLLLVWLCPIYPRAVHFPQVDCSRTIVLSLFPVDAVVRTRLAFIYSVCPSLCLFLFCFMLNDYAFCNVLIRSEDLRASTNHCISDVYLSASGSDLNINLALTQLPLPEVWHELQDLICISGEFDLLPSIYWQTPEHCANWHHIFDREYTMRWVCSDFDCSVCAKGNILNSCQH